MNSKETKEELRARALEHLDNAVLELNIAFSILRKIPMLWGTYFSLRLTTRTMSINELRNKIARVRLRARSE